MAEARDRPVGRGRQRLGPAECDLRKVDHGAIRVGQEKGVGFDFLAEVERDAGPFGAGDDLEAAHDGLGHGLAGQEPCQHEHPRSNPPPIRVHIVTDPA